MNCPYCNKLVYGMTGLQEALKFEKHLKKCKKNPNLVRIKDDETGVEIVVNRKGGLLNALEARAESGQ